MQLEVMERDLHRLHNPQHVTRNSVRVDFTLMFHVSVIVADDVKRDPSSKNIGFFVWTGTH